MKRLLRPFCWVRGHMDLIARIGHMPVWRCTTCTRLDRAY